MQWEETHGLTDKEFIEWHWSFGMFLINTDRVNPTVQVL